MQTWINFGGIIVLLMLCFSLQIILFWDRMDVQSNTMIKGVLIIAFKWFYCFSLPCKNGDPKRNIFFSEFRYINARHAEMIRYSHRIYSVIQCFFFLLATSLLYMCGRASTFHCRLHNCTIGLCRLLFCIFNFCRNLARLCTEQSASQTNSPAV